MRLIDASEMVKRLEEWNTADPMDKALYNFAMSRINEQPTVQPEPKWIPCSERLPEKYGWYMCTLKDYRVNTYYWNNKGEWIDNGKKHFFELYNISSRYTGEDITAEQEGSVYWTDWVIAWMPLPEPWKEGD